MRQCGCSPFYRIRRRGNAVGISIAEEAGKRKKEVTSMVHQTETVMPREAMPETKDLLPL